MRSPFERVCLAAALAALSSSLVLAQWPSYPTPGIPRLESGEPDLGARAPRTADGRPDLSGLWGLGGGGGGGRGRRGGGPPPAPPEGPPRSQFFEVAGRGFPLPIQPWAQELKDRRMADNSKDNPDAWCLPMGIMQFHNHPQPRRIVQTQDLMVIIYEANYGLRTIYLDGRPAPDNDPQPWWYGYSRGWWEGDELVVETTHYRGDERAGWLDVNGTPYSDALRTLERFRRPSVGQLEIDVTIDDPMAYTEPFTVRVNHRLLVDEEIIEFVCNENERSTEHFELEEEP
jgi:hypothetical protein